MMCVAQHMDEVMPFGEDPRKLASTVKRSMVAVRALEKALRSGFTIAEEMKKVYSNVLNPFLFSTRFHSMHYDYYHQSNIKMQMFSNMIIQ